MPTISNEALLAKWLDNALSKEEQALFEARYIEDSDFSARVDTANRVAFEVDQPGHVPPAWDKQQTVAFSRQPSHNRWSWMPAASMAMSFAAIVMVVTGFEVNMQDGRVQMGFDLGPSQQEVAALLDEKMAQHQQNNQVLLAQYIDALQEQNRESRTELTRFLLDTSREERREDFAELIKFINEQRDDDQRFYARQLNKLEAEVYSASLQE
ncbi:hypothetical protein DRW07_11645 [Alteromonas sediminis]|uniref:Uncharacterized protein n=1 Tax=Alteromonas sediminis TaxID=2259342 RepID=A0A3N5XZV9_9ALTE|nr:hypothetical protein [Alteromonas sediminis]RPJ66722.1 hypothetical protein DRW07_11645 [Alteromonas sediminis]